jgi:hypothetical protein
MTRLRPARRFSRVLDFLCDFLPVEHGPWVAVGSICSRDKTTKTARVHDTKHISLVILIFTLDRTSDNSRLALDRSLRNMLCRGADSQNPTSRQSPNQHRATPGHRQLQYPSSTQRLLGAGLLCHNDIDHTVIPSPDQSPANHVS